MPRVLLSCLQSEVRHDLPAHEFWRGYFVNGCREAGIECLEVPGIDWVEGLSYPSGPKLDEWRARTWEAVLLFARNLPAAKRIDFFLGYLYPKQIDSMAIAELQRSGIACVNFFCDNVREFAEVPTEYNPFALHWVPEFEALPMYRRAGLPHLNAPMPCWISAEDRERPFTESEPPTFIGSADLLRRELLGRAINEGADIKLRGPGWGGDTDKPTGSTQDVSIAMRISRNVSSIRRQGISTLYYRLQSRIRPLSAPPVPIVNIRPPVFGEDYFRVTREATITIGVNRVPTVRASIHKPLRYSRLRDIEAPMLGACYLTEWTEGLGNLFEIGAEVDSYRTCDELCEKIKELKADPGRRREMRQRAQKRALSDHSVAKSLQRICTHLGLRAAPRVRA